MDFKKVLFKTTAIDVEKALPDGIVFCNKDGKIQWVNDKAADIFETSKMHLMTSNINDFIENALSMVVTSIVNDEQIITKLKGKENYFDLTAKEIEEGYVLSFRDAKRHNNVNLVVNSEKNANQPVCKDKNVFLSKLDNEFKSPLQSIIGFAQAMFDGLGGEMSEQQSKYIKIIKKNSTDLMYFVTKLIELSATECYTSIPDLKTFDIVNLLNNVIKFNEQLSKEKDLTWTVDIQDGLKNTIVSNEDILKNIIQNLFEVILKSIDMGEIHVSISTPDEEFLSSKNLTGEYILMKISSNSLLFTESDLNNLFNPYAIIDSTSRKNLLRAITLASVKNMTTVLKGQIWVESQILKSTSFSLLIPQYRV